LIFNQSDFFTDQAMGIILGGTLFSQTKSHPTGYQIVWLGRPNGDAIRFFDALYLWTALERLLEWPNFETNPGSAKFHRLE
jgi:hypothetical protein